MFDCCKKINWGKVFLAGLAYTAIAFVLRQLETMLTMNYYKMPEYFGVWSKLMMPGAGAPPMSFFAVSLLFSFVTGVVLAAFYDLIKGLLSDGCCRKGLCFAGIIVCLSLVFFTLPAYLLFNLPCGLLTAWFVSSAAILYFASLTFARILK